MKQNELPTNVRDAVMALNESITGLTPEQLFNVKTWVLNLVHFEEARYAFNHR